MHIYSGSLVNGHHRAGVNATSARSVEHIADDHRCAMALMVNTTEWSVSLRSDLRTKAIAVCDDKIAKKGETVGLSFYAFFANKNDNPDLLMEAAEWWIKLHKLDHFEKAVKIRAMMVTGK